MLRRTGAVKEVGGSGGGGEGAGLVVYNGLGDVAMAPRIQRPIQTRKFNQHVFGHIESR